MIMRKLTLLFVLLLWSTPVFAQDATLDTKKLAADFSKIMAGETVKKTKVGVYAVDVSTGEVLLNLDGEKAFNPASNMKIITSASALDTFGASKVWATRLSAGKLVEGEVKTLYVKSDGDPLLRYEDFVAWAIALKQKGVKSVSGGIVIDNAAFDDTLPPGFEQQDEDASYRPDIGAFSVN